MNTIERFLIRAAALGFFLSAGAQPAAAFNQDHYFLHKTAEGMGGLRRVAYTPDGNIVAPEWDAQQISIFDGNLNLLTRVTGVPYPHGVDVAADGTIYVTTYYEGAVRKYDGAGNPLGVLISGLSEVRDVRVHRGDGTIYVRYGNGRQFKRLNPDGSLVWGMTTGADFSGWDVGSDGKIYTASGWQPIRRFNSNGIEESLPFAGEWGHDMRIIENRFYLADPWRPRFRALFADGTGAFDFPTNTPYYKTSPHALAVGPNGDIVTSDWGGVLFLWRRCEGNSMGPLVRNAAPTAEITAISQRANSTLLDVDFKVSDMDNSTVAVAAAAFRNNVNSLDNMILMRTLMEGSESKLGPAIATGTVHRITWDAGADWGVDFGDVSVHIFVRDNRPLLMGLHFLDLPSDGVQPALTITRSPVSTAWFLEPLMWLAASGDPAVTFSAGRIEGVDGVFAGELLASGTTVTQKGRELIESRMGVREATESEVQWAREAATPGIVNQWDVDPYTQKIDADIPRKVNEYGFDSGTYDANWIWLVKMN